MKKSFNTEGYCDPKYNYMVDLTSRLKIIRTMVDNGKYFTINRARQYGKSTTLAALADFLSSDYIVISMDFQGISYADFESEQSFVAAFSRQLLLASEEIPADVREELTRFATHSAENVTLSMLFFTLLKFCKTAEKEIVLLIDEVDSATNNQVFIDFLAQLRSYYLKRRQLLTFKSVILAGVYDVRNIKKQIRPDEGHRAVSPWNISADFDVDMSFSVSDIAGMLNDYESDCHTNMDIDMMAQLLYDYTSGYPYLVSRLCKLMDEHIAARSDFSDSSLVWSKAGFLEALKIILEESNSLYQSLKGKLEDYPNLRKVLYDLLFTGKTVPYTAMSDYIENAAMFGFIKNVKGTAVISNRIFETVLYNWFIAEEYADSKLYETGLQGKNQFVAGGHLNVRLVLEKFTESFDDLYGDQSEAFLEDTGRRYFMLFLKPIINGVGNCYVEAETRNHERTDLIIDYGGEQFIIEMKVWRGNAYNERGEQQLCEYLDYYHMRKGYMLSFNFNRKKEIGMKEIMIGDKVIIEAVV